MHKFTTDTPPPCFLPLCCPVCVFLFLWDFGRPHFSQYLPNPSWLQITTGSSNACPHLNPSAFKPQQSLLALNGLFSWDSGDGCFLFSSFHFIAAESNFSPTIMSSSWAVASQHFGLKEDSHCVEMANPEANSKQRLASSLWLCLVHF